jgi:hypothetical protein
LHISNCSLFPLRLISSTEYEGLTEKRSYFELKKMSLPACSRQQQENTSEELRKTHSMPEFLKCSLIFTAVHQNDRLAEIIWPAHTHVGG